jgi:hypothetical protein
MLTQEQINIGAMHLTTTDLDIDSIPLNKETVTASWEHCKRVYLGAGIDANIRLNDWKKNITNGVGVKSLQHELPWLFSS